MVGAVGTAVGVGACLVFEAWFSRMGGILVGGYPMLGVLGLWWVAFAVGAFCVLRLPPRAAVAVVAVGAILFTGSALTGGPQTSDDMYRYAWDGAVQSHGVDPYRYAPDDPRLAPVRDPWLWPSPPTCEGLGRPPNCTRVNRAGDRTIYPPIAEVWFRILHAVMPAGTRERGYQWAHALVGLGLTALLMGALRDMGRNPAWAVLWAWSPVGVSEVAMDAHVDVVAAVFVVGALWALYRKRAVLGGALLGVAVAVKLIPGVLVPAVVRWRPVRVVGTAVGVVALSYLPHVMTVGPKVLGYLPGYLQEEQYGAGDRFLLLRLLGLHGDAAKAVAVALLALAAAVAALRREPESVVRRARRLLVVVFLVVTPVQPWYAIVLVAVAVLDQAPEALAVAAAASPLYFGTILDVAAPGYGEISYGLAAVAVAAAALWRLRTGPGSSYEPGLVPYA